MNLAHLLSPELILCDIKSDNRPDIYREMLSKLKKHKYHDVDIESVCTEIINHEELIEIPYETGLAIPHTRSGSIKDLHIIIGIKREGVMLKENDLDKTHLIVMCLISKSTSNIYLLTISAISRFFMNNTAVEKVLTCKTPKDVVKLFEREKVDIKHSLTAADIMNRDFPFINQDQPLKDVIDAMVSSGRYTVPVRNAQNAFVGVVTVEHILKMGIPECIMLMENLSFLPNFEPFEDLLKTENRILAEEIMTKEPTIIGPDTPLLQIMVNLLRRKALCYYVVDSCNQLLGTISDREILKNVLRG